MKKNFALLMAGVMAAMCLTACGGSTPAATEAPKAAAPAATEAAKAEAPKAEAPAASGETYTITIGHINDESDSWHLAALKFKEYAEEKSNGQIQVDVFPNSQLGTEVEMIQSILSQGGCDITFTGESMQTYEPSLGIIGMPYAIQSDEHMNAVLTGDVGKQLEGLMEKAGMKVLGYFARGPRNITSNKEIKSVADMENFIIRTPQSAMTVAAFEAVGAKPTPMALAEVFTSLQQGTIEGQENPLAMIYTQSFYEVQKYLVKSEHLRAWVYIAMGMEQFNALPAELQQIVLDAGQEAQKYEHELFLENEKKLESQLVEKGMQIIEVDQSEFAAKMNEGVLKVLTPDQQALYDAMVAANPAK